VIAETREEKASRAYQALEIKSGENDRLDAAAFGSTLNGGSMIQFYRPPGARERKRELQQKRIPKRMRTRSLGG